MTKYLSILFHSFRYSFAVARPGWVIRLILYWEDFGHTIEWSETEKELLNVILSPAFAELKRQEEEKQRKNDEKRRKLKLKVRPHEPFRTLVQAKVKPQLEGCRWNTHKLSLTDLKHLVALAIAEQTSELEERLQGALHGN